MDSQHTWHGDNGLIRLWEHAETAFLGDVSRHSSTRGRRSDRDLWAEGHDPPTSLEDYLIEHRLRDPSTSIDDLTVREALMTLGLTQRAHLYPEWVCAEAWLFVALRIERRITAIEVLARAHDLGLSQSSITQARIRLGVIPSRQSERRHEPWRWQLPPSIAERGTPGDIDPRWRRYQPYM